MKHLRIGTMAVALLGSTALALASGTGTSASDSAPGAAVTQQQAQTTQNAQLSLSAEQRAQIAESITASPQQAPDGFSPSVGAQVPADLQLQPIPPDVASKMPELQSYEFAMLADRLLIVDPASREVVEVIER